MYNYENSGVNIKKADNIIKNIKKNFKNGNLENFAGMYCNNELFKGYNFVSCTDGIGSKIIPLIKYNKPKTIAQDLIAMNLNDLITLGAKPLFFLDYIAVNSLENNMDVFIQNVIEALKQELKKYSCMLLGCEISELKDLIKENYFDIAGFLVGYFKENYLDRNKTKAKDIVVAFPSNGIHSNGFSLIRKLYQDKKINEETFKKSLEPTKIYYDTVEKLISKNLIKSAANITGGGILSNLKRSVQPDLKLNLDYNSIPKQEIFEIIKNFVEIDECYKVFNMGVGFCVVADKNNVDEILKIEKNAFILGELS